MGIHPCNGHIGYVGHVQCLDVVINDDRIVLVHGAQIGRIGPALLAIMGDFAPLRPGDAAFHINGFRGVDHAFDGIDGTGACAQVKIGCCLRRERGCGGGECQHNGSCRKGLGKTHFVTPCMVRRRGCGTLHKKQACVRLVPNCACARQSTADLREASRRKRMSFSLYRLEMLREFQALTLIVRGNARAIELLRQLCHPLVDETADDLTVLQNKGGLVTAHFEHAPRSGPAFGPGVSSPKTGPGGTTLWPGADDRSCGSSGSTARAAHRSSESGPPNGAAITQIPMKTAAMRMAAGLPDRST